MATSEYFHAVNVIIKRLFLMEKLMLLLKTFGPISPGLEKHLRDMVRSYHFGENEYLHNAGEVADLILYLETGLVKSWSEIDGEKVCNWFMKEGNIIIAVESFLRQEPSHEYIQAIEPCKCWGFKQEDLENTYQLFPEFERHGRLITGFYYCMSEARRRSQLRRTPDDKYAYMMQTDSDLINRVVNSDMASYLDVSVRRYQKMRSDYAKPDKEMKKKKKKKPKPKK
jgi:CRP-like cAMP-binding protein